MRAALEEYNQKAGVPVSLKSPDKMDLNNEMPQQQTRRRGATIIGTREYLRPILDPQEDAAGQVPTVKEDENYNSIKMRYLRSLNISIAAPTKDIHVSASAPIPIPIPLKGKGDSDSDDERDQDDDDDIGFDREDPSSFMIGTPEISHMPMRKDSKSKPPKPHKFVPPHELLGNTNGESSLVNHSLPGNNRRKVFGQ
eukprot:gene1457-1690_t